jgi:hypothetical protein
MALAANVRQYFPPRHIQQMETDLASLSRFWDAGPWGWSLATRQRYLRMGIDPADLPSDEWLDQHRRLSSREFGVEYYQQLSVAMATEWGGQIVPCCARVERSLEGLGQLGALGPLESLKPLKPLGALILKAPWSSSGRGNIVVRGVVENFDQLLQQRIQRIIRQQGCIVVEPFYEGKVVDFAMEFDVSDTGARFLGYSVFDADEMGHYRGNCVESQEALRGRIGLPDALLQALVDYHSSALSRLPYCGPVGIDMMRLSDGRVHPCVEINFRRTMGLLALALYNKGITGNQLLAGNPRQGFSAQIIDGKLCLRFNIGN